jgi:threonine dehydrogenase-like Zn-dependent dehydrogenase
MTCISFEAFDYTSNDAFIRARYDFEGSREEGWTVIRNGEKHLALGKGYRLLKTRVCGICSTDIARRFLPFPLPQILGHEVVATDPDSGGQYVVEINDTCDARGDADKDIFCRAGLPTHCPDRMVLGIDRLPGGFGPYILAPVNAVIQAEKLPIRTAALVEPFAAALHAVNTSRPQKGERIAVLGTGRLGSLIIAALHAWRRNSGTDFSITALAIGEWRARHSLLMGADDAVDLERVTPEELKKSFDLVFEATGSPSGLESALTMARREVHLKSTHGRDFFGLKHLTEVVVDELSILPYSKDSLDFTWDQENRKNETVYSPPGVAVDQLPAGLDLFRGSTGNAGELLAGEHYHGRLPRFDIGIASTVEEIDAIIRPDRGTENSLVRPRGAILFKGDIGANPLLSFIASGRRIRTSRCGDFHRAIALLENDPALAGTMTEHMITHEAAADDLPRVYLKAKDSDMLKILIRHDT